MADGSVIISTELDNSGIEKGLKDTEKTAKKAGKSVDSFGKEFKNAEKTAEKSTKNIESGLKDVKDTLTDLATTVGIGLGFDALVSGANNLIESTEELRGDLSMLDQNARTAGVGIDVARQSMQTLNTVSGEADSSVEAVSNLLAAGIPENRLQAAVEGLSNAVITFPDTLKVESLADSLQETLATGTAVGQFGEYLDRVGIGAEAFSASLALCTTEAEKQELALSTLTSGPLSGVYDGWKKANPELVAGRDAALELNTAMAEMAEALVPVKTGFVEFATGLIDFVQGTVGIDTIFEILITGLLTLTAMKAIDIIQGIAIAFTQLNAATALAAIQSTLATGAIGALIFILLQVAQAWDSMTGIEKVTVVLGSITVAAFAAAMAVGAFQSALTLGVAAIAIAGGIATIMLALNSARQRAEREAEKLKHIRDFDPNAYNSSMGRVTIPGLATGAVIPPNRKFMAVLGDQTNGRNLEAPEGLIRQIVREESGGGGATVIRFSGSLAQLARVLKPEIDKESTRAGAPLVGGAYR